MGSDLALPFLGPLSGADHLADGCTVQARMPADFGGRVAGHRMGPWRCAGQEAMQGLPPNLLTAESLNRLSTDSGKVGA